jgi:hypothetical protein
MPCTSTLNHQQKKQLAGLQIICSFIHNHEFLLDLYCVTGNILYAANIAVNKADQLSIFLE